MTPERSQFRYQLLNLIRLTAPGRTQARISVVAEMTAMLQSKKNRPARSVNDEEHQPCPL